MSNETGSEQQPSKGVTEGGKLAIFKPTRIVLDDVNIDLICVAAITATLLCAGIFPLYAKLLAPGVAAIVLPLRLFFPRPRVPTGLVLITGASSGVGAELSYIFAEKGHDLVLVGRNKEQLASVKQNVEQRYSRSAKIIPSDLSVQGAAKKLYNDVVNRGLIVEVLVNGAGLGSAGDTLEQSIELAERMTTLNCISVVQLTQLFGKDMAKRGRGWILQVSSVGGWLTSPHHNLYHATKHFVRAFSEALSVELRGYPGVVNTQLMPGPTHTQFITRSHAEETVMMAAPVAMENPKKVAMAGYRGLAKGKRMVFSSWNAAVTALLMQLAPRSVHVTISSLLDSPLRGLDHAAEPEKDQKARGSNLEDTQ